MSTNCKQGNHLECTGLAYVRALLASHAADFCFLMEIWMLTICFHAFPHADYKFQLLDGHQVNTIHLVVKQKPAVVPGRSGGGATRK